MQGKERADFLFFGSAVLLGLAGQWIVGWHAPLWLDETYTAVIASQPNVAGLIDWCRHELSGPFYYALEWLWTNLAGTSDTALRLPSLIFSFAAIAIIILRGSEDRKVRLIWAALLACWFHGMFYASQARPQALLLLLATGQAILFARCYRQAGLRNASGWALLSALLLLTHIHAIVLAALQGLALAWCHRTQWRSLWPALLAFLPALGWLALQLPFMLTYAQPENTWYPLLGVSDVGRFWPDLLGGALVALIALIGVALAMLQANVRKALRDEDGKLRAEAVLPLLSIFAALAIIAVGMVRPSYDARYLVPFVPALLFGIAYVLRQGTSWRVALPYVVVGAFAVIYALNANTLRPAAVQRSLYPLEFQSASQWLMQRDSSRILFAWDNRTAAINSEQRLREVGSFFFKRAGHQVTTNVVRFADDDDRASKLMALSKVQHADILWVGGKAFPDALLTSRELNCQRFGDANSSQSLACHRND